MYRLQARMLTPFTYRLRDCEEAQREAHSETEFCNQNTIRGNICSKSGRIPWGELRRQWRFVRSGIPDSPGIARNNVWGQSLFHDNVR
jgi:hypothetical protein